MGARPIDLISTPEFRAAYERWNEDDVAEILDMIAGHMGWTPDELGDRIDGFLMRKLH